MAENKNVMISQQLFFDLIKFFKFDQEELRAGIDKQLTIKLEKLVNHDLYTQYLTAASEEERELARKQYLDNKGIPEAFRY